MKALKCFLAAVFLLLLISSSCLANDQASYGGFNIGLTGITEIGDIYGYARGTTIQYSLNNGGGFGGLINLGYSLYGMVDLNATYGMWQDTASGAELASGDSKTTFTGANIKLTVYKFYSTDKQNNKLPHFIKIGAGLGIYQSQTNLTIYDDITEHRVVTYRPQLGYQLLGDYKSFLTKNLSSTIGFGLDLVKPVINSITVNGEYAPVNTFMDTLNYSFSITYALNYYF